MNNKIHEAGYFIRNNLKKFPQHNIFNSDELFNNLNKTSKEINVIAVPSDISQAKITHKILKGLPEGIDETHDKTALVLPDESLLLSVLSSVPEELENINITMGYPIKDTSVFSFIEFLINLHTNSQEEIAVYGNFYYLDVLAILNHQYIITLEPGEANRVTTLIRNNNLIYISNQEFENNALFKIIFKAQKTAVEFSSYIMDVLFFILEKDSENNDTQERSISIIEKEFIYKVYLSLKRLTEIIKGQKDNPGMAVLMKVIRQTISSLRIPFEGEPLKGLQIMGLLETRLLDFENLIILSVNEGTLPKKHIDSSFIPYNIRKAFGLPVAEHQDAIYAYYFYRLIQRAKNIYIVYNSSVSDKGLVSGEISRFLSQLKIETDFKIIESNIGFDLSYNSADNISVQKTQSVIERLALYYSDNENPQYLSPSAINTYIDCSLKFYFRYIAGLKETEEITEEVDPLLFGNILHKTMEKLYSDFGGKYVKPEDIESILSDKDGFDEIVKNAFIKVYYKSDNRSINKIPGKNRLVYEIIKKYVVRVLEFDKISAPFSIIDLELFLKTNIEIDVGGNIQNIDLGGTIDRVDRHNDIVRIIDYKTGKAPKSYKPIQSLFENNSHNRDKAAFQTMLYSKMYQESNAEENNICPSVYYVRDLYKLNYNWRLKSAKNQIDIYKPFDEEFSGLLQEVLSEMFDPMIHFVQTEEEKNCGYCPYISICKKPKADKF